MIQRQQQLVALWIVALIAFFWIDTVSGSAFPMANRPIFIKSEHPLDVIKRLPVTVLDTSLISTKSFLETAAMVIPGGLIWKIGDLRTLGWKVWLMGAVKMGTEWGSISALFSGGEKFFAGIRGIDDKYNQYIACGICSAIHKIKEGYAPMAQGFVTGFAFVYVLDKLAATMADPEAAEPTVKGRQALESAAATKGTTTSTTNLNRSKVTSQHRVTSARRALRKG